MDSAHSLKSNCMQPLVLRTCILCSYIPLRRSPSESALRLNYARNPFYQILTGANQRTQICTYTCQKMDSAHSLKSNCTQPLAFRACPLCSYVPLRRSPSESALRLNYVRNPFYRILTGATQRTQICTYTYQNMDSAHSLKSNCTQPLVFRACPLCSYVPLRRSPSESALRLNYVRNPFYRILTGANQQTQICTYTCKKNGFRA